MKRNRLGMCKVFIFSIIGLCLCGIALLLSGRNYKEEDKSKVRDESEKKASTNFGYINGHLEDIFSSWLPSNSYPATSEVVRHKNALIRNKNRKRKKYGPPNRRNFTENRKSKFSKIRDIPNIIDIPPSNPKIVIQSDKSCGKTIMSKSHPMIYGGNHVNYKEAPWHVTLYAGERAVCGGTIISEFLVITAAHCLQLKVGSTNFPVATYFMVAKETIEADIIDFAGYTDKYRIAGKYTVKSFDMDDEGRLIANDLAIVESDRPIVFNEAVVPACLNWDWFGVTEFPEDSPGMIVGMGNGHPDMNHPPKHLKAVISNFKNYTTCLALTGIDRPGTFCGFTKLDESDQEGLVIEKLRDVIRDGYVGGGFLLKHLMDVEGSNRREEKFYLYGVLSQFVNTKTEAILTDIGFHIRWIRDVRVFTDKRRSRKNRIGNKFYARKPSPVKNNEDSKKTTEKITKFLHYPLSKTK